MFYLPEVKPLNLRPWGTNGLHHLNMTDGVFRQAKSDDELEIERRYSSLEKELIKTQREIDMDLTNMRRRIKEKIQERDGEFENLMYRNISAHASNKLAILKERVAITGKKLDFKLKFSKGSAGSIEGELVGEEEVGLAGTSYNAPKTSFASLTGVQNNASDNTKFAKDVDENMTPKIEEEPSEEAEAPVVMVQPPADISKGFRNDTLNNINYSLAAQNMLAKERNIEVVCHVSESGRYWLTYEEDGVEVEGISKKRVLTMKPLSINKQNMTATDGSGTTYPLSLDDERNMPEYYRKQWQELQEF